MYAQRIKRDPTRSLMYEFDRQREEKVEHTRREKEEAIRGQDFEIAAMLRDAEEDFR